MTIKDAVVINKWQGDNKNNKHSQMPVAKTAPAVPGAIGKYPEPNPVDTII